MQHVYHRRVHFADTDAAGVVHFSRLLCYVEEAEHEFLKKLDIPLLLGGGWPRVHVECNYNAPARMGDSVEVSLTVEKLGKTSIAWSFSMAIADQEIATGKMKTVRVDESGNAEELDDAWRSLLLG